MVSPSGVSSTALKRTPSGYASPQRLRISSTISRSSRVRPSSVSPRYASLRRFDARREELRDEVAVAGGDLDAVVAGGLEVRGRRGECVHDHAHLRDAHLVRRVRVARRGNRRRRERNGVSVSPARRLAAEMDELAEDARAVALHRVDPCTQRVDPVLVPGLGDDAHREHRRRVDDCRAGDDQPDAGARPLLLESDVAFGHASALDQSGAHRRLDDPVADREPADLAGREQMRIGGHSAVAPPSATSMAAVKKLESSENRKHAVAAISSGSASRAWIECGTAPSR